jgi:hypothetical protein
MMAGRAKSSCGDAVHYTEMRRYRPLPPTTIAIKTKARQITNAASATIRAWLPAEDGQQPQVDG